MIQLTVKTNDEGGNKSKRVIKQTEYGEGITCQDFLKMVYDMTMAMGYNHETVEKYLDIECLY